MADQSRANDEPDNHDKDGDLGSGSISKTNRNRYVRVMTDKRREQNRRAQRNYREKVKRKLADIEDQITTITSDGFQAKTLAVEPNAIQTGQDRGSPGVQAQALAAERRTLDLSDIFTAAGDLPVPSNPLFLNRLTSSASSSFVDSSGSSNHSPRSAPRPCLLQNEFGTTDMLNIWQMPYRPPNRIYTPAPDAASPYMAGALTTVTPDYAYRTQKRLAYERSPITNSDDSAPQFSVSNKQSLTNMGSPFPSPHINFIKLTSDRNLEATLAIGISLGISRDAYFKDHPSRFPQCFEEIWPADMIPDPKNGNVLSIKAPRNTSQAFLKFRLGSLAHCPLEICDHVNAIKPSLRPRPVQLLEAHPSYLDCIVFPRFRERAVQASVDGVLDHVEFFLDIIHGGLVCWASQTPTGASLERKGQRRRDMFDQVAWSTRSWEARKWFLKKWAWLVGSEEEELDSGDTEGIWAGSRWWWAMRGDLDDNSDEILYD